MKVPFPTAESQDLQTSFSDPITTLATASVVPWSAGVVHKPREQHLPPVKCKHLYCILLLGKAGLILFITATYRLKLSAQQQTAGATYSAKFHFTQRINADVGNFASSMDSEKVRQISTHLLCSATVNRRESELILFYLNILCWTVLCDHDLLQILNTCLILTVRVIPLTSVFKLSSAFTRWIFS